MKKIEFEAYYSGDWECFVFAVDKEIYKKIKGEEPDEFNQNDFIEKEELYNLYPNEILPSGFSDIQIKRKITITEEEI